MISDLIIRFDSTGERGCLHHPLCASWVDDIGAHNKVVIPVGFRTDFASIPQGVRSLIPQLGKWTAPAVVHDALYWAGPSWGYTQAMADYALLQLMSELGVGAIRKHAIYRALRMFGSFAWNNHRKLGHSENDMIQEDCY